jgi:hypothetical protein
LTRPDSILLGRLLNGNSFAKLEGGHRVAGERGVDDVPIFGKELIGFADVLFSLAREADHEVVSNRDIRRLASLQNGAEIIDPGALLHRLDDALRSGLQAEHQHSAAGIV